MNNTQTSLQNSPAGTSASQLTIRQLSTEQQNDWIERILERLTQIYGRDFTYKWEGLDAGDMKREWADTLGGFHAEDIAAALKACRAQPKAPNLPEFAGLCRQNMNTRSTPSMPPLSSEQKAAAARVAKAVADGLKSKEANTKGYMVNGTLVTVYKQWAVDLMRREAGGESLPIVSTESWREVLGYPKDADARKALEAMKAAA